MITFLRTAIAQHTERFFTLRRLEVEAGRTLAHAAADVGDQLNQIQAELYADAEGPTWTAWLETQRSRATDEGLPPMAERTARNYMALARFRQKVAREFPQLMHLDPACLYPMMSLPEADVRRLIDEGVETGTGKRLPVQHATSRQIGQAVQKTPAKTPTCAETFQKAMEMLKSLGELTEAEQAELAALQPAPAEEPAETPVQTYQGMLGPVTLQGGRPVIGTLDRNALADTAIAAIREATSKCKLVSNGTGKLSTGRKTTALDAVTELRLAALKWPAWS